MAVFLAISSREVISKIVSIWFPVMCFVGLGTDHVIANSTYTDLLLFLPFFHGTRSFYELGRGLEPRKSGQIL
jgi:formate/nitrite transporter FocA (FNT family)